VRPDAARFASPRDGEGGRSLSVRYYGTPAKRNGVSGGARDRAAGLSGVTSSSSARAAWLARERAARVGARRDGWSCADAGGRHRGSRRAIHARPAEGGEDQSRARGRVGGHRRGPRGCSSARDGHAARQAALSARRSSARRRRLMTAMTELMASRLPERHHRRPSATRAALSGAASTRSSPTRGVRVRRVRRFTTAAGALARAAGPPPRTERLHAVCGGLPRHDQQDLVVARRLPGRAWTPSAPGAAAARERSRACRLHHAQHDACARGEATSSPPFARKAYLGASTAVRAGGRRRARRARRPTWRPSSTTWPDGWRRASRATRARSAPCCEAAPYRA